MEKIRGKVVATGLQIGGAPAVTPLLPVAATSVKAEARTLPVRSILFTVSALAISMAAADDFGSAKLCDLPNTNLIILGAAVDLTGTVSGFTSDVGTAVDLAIGTVATASAAFSNAGEKDIVPKIDGTGAGTTATITGRNTTTEKLAFIAAGASNALYINASDPVTSGTGVLTLSGTVEIFYVDTSS